MSLNKRGGPTVACNLTEVSPYPVAARPFGLLLVDNMDNRHLRGSHLECYIFIPAKRHDCGLALESR